MRATQEKMDEEGDSTGIFMAGVWATVRASWFDSEAPPELRHGIATAAASVLRSDTQRTHPDAPNLSRQSTVELARLTLPPGLGSQAAQLRGQGHVKKP